MDALIAFIATADPARALSFYRDVLLLQFVSDDPFALVFKSGETLLRIQKVSELHPHPFTALGWKVSDIDAALSGLVTRGVTFEQYGYIPQDERGIWITPDGTKVAWFKDPDGNTLSLTESAGK